MTSMPETFWWDTLSNSVAGIVGGLSVAAIAGFLVYRRTHFENTPEDDYESLQGPAAKWYSIGTIACLVCVFMYFTTWNQGWLFGAILIGVVAAILALRFFLTTLAWGLAGPARRKAAAEAQGFDAILARMANKTHTEGPVPPLPNRVTPDDK